MTTNIRKRLKLAVTFFKNSSLNFTYLSKTITFATQKSFVTFF